jgi:hypothetical protein
MENTTIVESTHMGDWPLINAFFWMFGKYIGVETILVVG